VNSAKDQCIIVDLDGTLANCDHRVHYVQSNPKDWDSFNSEMGKDQLNAWCAQLIEAMHSRGIQIILLTGRDDNYEKSTIEWLNSHQIEYHQLFMRKANDEREDHIIKREIFLEKIAPQYKTLFVVEDRLSVVKMWREMNITCLQCDWGDF